MTREEAIALLESRRDLIKSDYPEIDDYREALDIAINVLRETTGEWICRNRKCWDGLYYCSKCGKSSHIKDNYCSRCGASMENK